MFTGIVSNVGEVVDVELRSDVRRIVIAASSQDESPLIGGSIACSGICLTVVAWDDPAGRARFTVELGPETLRLTTAGDWIRGTRLNLERSLRLGDELGGHMVTGHVDGIARVIERTDFGETVSFRFAAPEALAKYVAAKGSVTLDGTSLTVNSVDGVDFECHLIPHTLAITSWGERQVGDSVNLEVDLMARYTERLLQGRSRIGLDKGSAA